MTEDNKKQLLYFVFGGKLKNLNSNEFTNPDDLDIVGIFMDYQSAQDAWRAKAQSTVDNALQRYYIVDLHQSIHSEIK
ncbi:hypothetical protein X471_01119 [Bartonella bacilliformis str. Heidi Mejia]|uniref:DUF4170 domain-containing protein n=1 Tax=Bartonella bacilliformis TaxID=774 RepID=UPI000452F2D3|nr:DUF4170 domain-containing protein [Bartonella bacilliformis]EYS90985.1 hypothetical protein X471_01119 [Bartonella bacilliformis str. Heidi Mejia]KEG15696.1 hypothetical protein H705_01125 [Bartonella bacilliformis Cond044]KEG17901.1 hypothetical protein H707_01071 [Bartonella bacilliformis Hosp800-02]KEG21822.1 hypothetical protein H708_01076 [Bartonella bacilliformis VAB9028]KEG23197.1 hypothetical protein H706_01086 [Bartonella bacilliformis CAR600-02]